MPFTPQFFATGLKPKRTTDPGGGTVPGERLQEDLKNQWGYERDAWVSHSAELWGKQQLYEVSWASLLHSPSLKPAELGIQTWPTFGLGGEVVVFAGQYLNIARVTILYFYSRSSYQLETCVHPSSLDILLFWLFNAQNCSQDLGFIFPFIIAGLLRNARLLAALCFVVTRRESTASFILEEQNTVTETFFGHSSCPESCQKQPFVSWLICTRKQGRESREMNLLLINRWASASLQLRNASHQHVQPRAACWSPAWPD